FDYGATDGALARDGSPITIKHLAKRAGIKLRTAECSIKALVETGLIRQMDAVLQFPLFAEWQKKSKDAQRKQEERDKKNPVRVRNSGDEQSSSLPGIHRNKEEGGKGEGARDVKKGFEPPADRSAFGNGEVRQ